MEKPPESKGLDAKMKRSIAARQGNIVKNIEKPSKEAVKASKEADKRIAQREARTKEKKIVEDYEAKNIEMEQFVRELDKENPPKETSDTDALSQVIDYHTAKVRGMREAVGIQHKFNQEQQERETKEQRREADTKALWELLTMLEQEKSRAEAEGKTETSNRLEEIGAEMEKEMQGLINSEFSKDDDPDGLIKDSEERTAQLEQELAAQTKKRDGEIAGAVMPGLEKELDEEVYIQNAESLLEELAAKDKTSPEAKVMPELKELASRNKESIEQAQLEKAIKEAGEARTKAIDKKTPADQKNFIKETANWYRKMPTSAKIAISASLLGAGVATSLLGGPASVMTGLWLAQRAFSAVGAYAAADLATERMRNRYLAGVLSGGAGVAALMLPSAIHYVDGYFGLNQRLRDWFSSIGARSPGTGFGSGWGDWHPFSKDTLSDPVGTFERTPSAPNPLESINIFDNPITVTEQDRLRGLWGILERKLTDAHMLDNTVSPQRKNYMIDFLEKKLQALGPETLKDLGFGSGNINVIRAGEQLNLSVLEKKGWLQHLR